MMKIVSTGVLRLFCVPKYHFYSSVCDNFVVKAKSLVFKNHQSKTSLMVQWVRIHLPLQGTQDQYLVWEDSTCRTAAKPACYNYWSLRSRTHALQTLEAHVPRACDPQQEKPPQWEAREYQRRAAQLEKAHTATEIQRSCRKKENSSD